MKTLLIITEGPASLKAWNALRLAAALISQDMDVAVFLLDEGTYLARQGQRPVDRLSELGADRKLAGLIDMGVSIHACGVCLDHRGLAEGGLVRGVQIATMVDLAKLVAQGERVISL